jgi:hypothetical protein
MTTFSLLNTSVNFTLSVFIHLTALDMTTVPFPGIA